METGNASMNYQTLVLLSTYNGEKYLCELFDSILSQKSVEVFILIRDDGSTDRTMEIINNYCLMHNNISVIASGENLGSGNSFMRLVDYVGKYCLEQFQYFAFADQDDIWLEQKLNRAISKINNAANQKGILYCSNQIIYKNETVIGKRFITPPKIDIASVINSNKVSGCTFVLNKKMMSNICLAKHPSNALISRRMHDVWIVLAALCSGKVIYDDEAFILYRIHANNVVGVKEKTIKEKVSIYWKNLTDRNYGRYRSRTAEEVLIAFPKVEGRTKDILEELSYYQKDVKMKRKLLDDTKLLAIFDDRLTVSKIKVLLNLV